MRGFVSAVFMAGLLAASCLAQDAKSTPPTLEKQKFYRLVFVLREVEGEKVINSRSYSMVLASEHARDSIRTNSKLPVGAGANNWQYIDVGVNIDCQDAEESGTQLSLKLKADITSPMVEADQKIPAGAGPVLRTNQWESRVILPLRQPTLLFSSDDPGSQRKMQLQLTATPIAP